MNTGPRWPGRWWNPGRMTMRWLRLLVIGWLVTGCGTSEPARECTTSSDCTGDPGAGCHWICKDGRCEELCDQECSTADDCQELPWELQCPGHWECVDGSCVPECDPGTCTQASDCEDLTPPDTCAGAWSCVDGSCVWNCDQECTAAEDCLELPWEAKCSGYWACEQGSCVPRCGDPCGDGVCQPAEGESAASCPQDCTQQCRVPADCAGQEWDVRCVGRWACVEGVCEEMCDERCGDGECDVEGGETEGSCPVDCTQTPECERPRDCLDRSWDVDCTGHWACEQGVCREVCDDVGCGDGHCDTTGGESPASCPEDCSAACETPVDCLEYEWNVWCQGHWGCTGGQCHPVCEDQTCGDGICDPEGGETPVSCMVDCQPECETPVDCLELTWAVDCVGHWGCEQGTCLPVCDPETCGDGDCDPDLGESAGSCPLDCEAACVEEGLPTGVPPACCEGLDALSDCVPDQPCPGSLLFCVDCGNQSCDPHENPYNCLEDCPEGCPIGASAGFTCPGGDTVPWCTCVGPACPPECMFVGSYSEGWYDSCTGELLGDFRPCADQQPVCRLIGTESEGWYDQDGEIIEWAYCAPLWDCLVDPKIQCQ